MQSLRCGAYVTEIDGKHIGVVRSFEAGNGRPINATIVWCESGWVSERVPIETLMFAPDDEI